jgi:SAM-dependent methyltransferase
MSEQRLDTSAFDAYAAQYDAALEKGISISGEGKDYFARGRVLWLRKVLSAMGLHPKSVLDFGCGTGTAAPLFKEILGAETVLGVDVSAGSLEVARKTHGDSAARFLSLNEYEPDASLDLAFCNGVFHHVPPNDRAGAVNYVWNALRPGGLFAFWENNPWNPGTRIVMSRIPFDRDAILVSPIVARSLLKAGGFQIVRTDFQFIFPRSLAVLRPLERVLSALPLGAQFQVLCRK